MSADPPKKDNPQDERLRVFISHVAEDSQVVSELYSLLNAHGAQPWMGMGATPLDAYWQAETSDPVKWADAVIFCVSEASLGVEEVAYEFSRALGQTGISHNLLLISARLEDCPMPAVLTSLRYVDLFRQDGFEGLAQALSDHAKKLGRTPLDPGHRRELSSSLASDLLARGGKRRTASGVDSGGGGGVDQTPLGAGATSPGDEGGVHEIWKEVVEAEAAKRAQTQAQTASTQQTDPAQESHPTAQSADAGTGTSGGGDAAGAAIDQSPPDSSAPPKADAPATPKRVVVKSGLDESARSRSATNDKPQTDVERDTLGFRDFVFALRDFVVSEDTTTPLTISVNGAWGSGKSSLMGMLRQQLEAPPPAGLWRVKLGWLGRWARATPVALAGRLLAWSEHWDAEYIRLGLCFAPADEVTDENFEELLRAHVAAAVGAQFSPALLDSMEAERATAYVEDITGRSRRWARAAARRRKMKPHDHPTVWFNAWKFSEQEQVWSALALALLEQLKTKYGFSERALFLARLTLRRTDKRRAVAQLARRLLVPAVLAIAAIAYASLYETLKARYESYFVLPANLTWLAPALAAAWQAWKAVENPFHLPAAEVVDQPDYREKVGFLGAFGEDFARIVETAVRRSFFWRPRKLVVFIDDLDRCSPLQAAGVIEAINLFLDSVGCVFILGMDMAAVATSIEVKYKELAERMRNDSPDLLSPGSLFLDKIVQIPFNVPRPSPQRIEALVNSITEPRAQAPRLALLPPPAPREEIGPRTVVNKISVGENGYVTATTTISAASTGGTAAAIDTTAATASGTMETTHASDDGAAVASQTAAATQVDRGSFARTDIKEAVVYASRLLKENPRQVKRFVNLFRLQIYIADQRGLLSEEGEQGLTPKRLAVWVAWYMQWPELLKLLSGVTYGSELRNNLAGISRRLVMIDEDKDCGVKWSADGKGVYLGELAVARNLSENSSSHWSKLPWHVWISDPDFLHCLKDLEPYWHDRRLLDSVADMTQFSIDPPFGVAADAPPAPPAPAGAAHAHAGNGSSPAP